MSTETPTATPEVDPKATPVEPVTPTEPPAAPAAEEPLGESGIKALPVSYTHLTLPTNREV